MDIFTDYEPGDEWDWDFSDESQYCVHGRFIGSWWGPDVLCGYCEDGVSLEEYQAMIRLQELRRERERRCVQLFKLTYGFHHPLTVNRWADCAMHWLAEIRAGRL